MIDPMVEDIQRVHIPNFSNKINDMNIEATKNRPKIIKIAYFSFLTRIKNKNMFLT